MDVIISSEPIQDGMVETLATCHNISKKGIRLEWDVACKKDDIVYLRCFSNTTSAYIDIQCQVVWVSKKPEEKYYLIGLKFLDISDEDGDRLLEF